MFKLVLILMSFLITANAVLAKSVASGNGLHFIGTFRSRESVIQGRSTQLYDENNYYMSQNSGAWNSARSDCKTLIGDNATLVAIETEEEWKFLKKILQDYGFAHDYWTDGMWDVSSSRWRWLETNAQLEPFAPWAAVDPTNPNSLLRVVINYRNAFDSSWRTVSYTQLHRYICEVQVPSTAIAHPCYQVNDLVIVLDSSGSIGSENFQTALQFVERLASAFTVYSPSRLAFVTFSHHAHIHIDLTNALSAGEISSRILSTEFEAGSTNTNYGIIVGMHQLTSDLRGVPMNMVVLTDGESNILESTIAAAQEAIGAGIRMFAVGITPYINKHELLEIAANDPDRMFTTLNFDELINLLAPLSKKICAA